MHGTLGAKNHANTTTSFTPWTPGCDPTLHPLWQEQVELELEMVKRGADKYRKHVAKARAKMEMTSVKAFHYKVEAMVPVMVPVLKKWKTAQLRSKGGRSVVFDHLRMIDPSVACFICLRSILDSVTIGNLNLTFVARKIGMDVEHQARMAAWEANAPDLYFGVQNSISKHATHAHIRRVNINRFNTLMKGKLQWQAWSSEVKLHVGFRLIDIAVQATGMFEVNGEHGALQHSCPNGGQAKRPSGRKTVKDITPNYTIRVAEPVLEELMKRIDDDETRRPQYLPTLMPPKRWTGIFDGAYYTPVVRTPTLVRFHADGEDQRQAALEEYNDLDMPRAMSALHYVQETPWMVNQRVLAVALQVWDRDLAITGFPKRDIVPIPPRPSGDHPSNDYDLADKLVKEYEPKLYAIPALTEKERKAGDPDPRAHELASWPAIVHAARKLVKDWKRAAANIYQANAMRTSKAGVVRETLMLAEKFMRREFYFPHMLDFRGRMYPIATYLQPQGNDLARGLLTFAKGMRIGENGGWLAVHLANHFGHDKVSNDERIKWVEENEDRWRTIAADPIGSHHLWLPDTGRKHHWQGLAAVFEWVRYLDEGPEMLSSLPIHIDGTCNGIQHLSAMMRDEVGGAAVNLVPSDKPEDIYADVASSLEERLRGIVEAGGAQGQLAQQWLDVFSGGCVPRSLTKKPVMTTPYGATREAHFGSLHDWLEENSVRFAVDDDEDKAQKKVLVPWLIKHLEDALSDKVARAKVCMKWLQDVAKQVAVTNQPIVWRTPSGFVVRHFYGKNRARMLKTDIDRKQVQLQIYTRTATLSEREQLQGIAPNFTHSMDASANTETIIRMALGDGAPPITAIHDAYGTVAGAMWRLFGAVRSAFIWVHSDDVLADFRNVCVSMYRDHLLATEPDLEISEACARADHHIKRLPPERGSLDVSVVADSDYFFA